MAFFGLYKKPVHKLLAFINIALSNRFPKQALKAWNISENVDSNATLKSFGRHD